MTKFFNLKNKIKVSQEVKMVFFECLIFVIGFFLSGVRFIFGIYPFGLAFACATKKYSPFALAGSALGCIFLLNTSIVYLIAYGAILGLRLICSLIIKRDKKQFLSLGKKDSPPLISLLFCENTSVRVVICSFVALGIGTFTVVSNGYLFYDIFVLIFFAVVCGALTFSLCGLFDSSLKKSYSLGLVSLAFMLLYGIRAFEIFGINPSMVLGCCIILYASRYLNGSYGGIIGLLLGICHGPSYAAVFGLLGVISGFIWRASPYLATMCAFTVSMGYGVYAGGYDALVYLAPELLLSCLLMYTLLRFELLPVPEFIKVRSKHAEAVIFEKQREQIKERIDSLSASLLDISSMIRDVSARSKSPTRQSYAQICLDAVEEHCYSCPKKSICWEKDTQVTEENLDKLSNSAFTEGAVSKVSVSEKFLHRCPNIDSIMEKINDQSKKILTQGAKNDKLEVSSLSYELVSKMVNQIMESDEDREIYDSQGSIKAQRALARVGLEFERVKVFGTKEKKIIILGIDTDRTKCTEAEARAELEKSLDVKLSEPDLTIENDLAVMTFSSASIYSATAYTSGCVAENEKINGDSVSSFTAGNLSYTVLCDGMGSGPDARLTSLLSVTFLEKLLRAGAKKELSLSMLNAFIRARNEECTSSVDLLELDLSCGSGRLIKSGAAPTFIKRGENVFRLQSKTMPIGILKDIYAEELSFEVRDKDICIMLSDGVCATNEDSDRIIRLLKETKATEKELPALIIKEMKKHRDRQDDMTVAALLVEKKEP